MSRCKPTTIKLDAVNVHVKGSRVTVKDKKDKHITMFHWVTHMHIHKDHIDLQDSSKTWYRIDNVGVKKLGQKP